MNNFIHGAGCATLIFMGIWLTLIIWSCFQKDEKVNHDR